MTGRSEKPASTTAFSPLRRTCARRRSPVPVNARSCGRPPTLMRDHSRSAISTSASLTRGKKRSTCSDRISANGSICSRQCSCASAYTRSAIACSDSSGSASPSRKPRSKSPCSSNCTLRSRSSCRSPLCSSRTNRIPDSPNLPCVRLKLMTRNSATQGDRAMNAETSPQLAADIAHIYAQQRRLAEAAAEQVNDAQFFEVRVPESNSIAIIMKHVGGNLRSRFTDFLTTDGEKPDRNREGEFVAAGETRASVMQTWQNGWRVLESTLASLSAADLQRTVTIRGEPCTVTQAL